MKLNSIACTICISLSSFSVAAQDAFQAQGSSLTRGFVSYKADPMSSINNPAAPSFFMHGNDGFQSNFIAPFGLGYEIGKIDSLIDELDELIDILEDDNLSAEQALDAKNRFEPFLVNAARDGMIKVGGNLGMPFFPAFYHSNSLGTFSAQIQFSGAFRSTVLDDNIDIISFNNTFKINTSAAVYIKSAGKATLGLGFSRSVWEIEDSALHAGVNIKINQFELAKNVISLTGLEDGENIGDAIEDDYETNANTSTNVSIDAGLLWVASNLSVGLSLKDINEPEYEYGTLASDCAGRLGVSLDNCYVAQDAIAQGRLVANEVYVANSQATVEVSTWVGDEVRWGLHSSYDLNDKTDPIGDIYQWANVSTSAQLGNWFIPEIRVGYSKNMAGTKLSYYSVGITFFKQADLDIRWSDESVDIDGRNAPRSAYFSFSVQTRF